MKVLHVSTGDSAGGAARGAYWLHHALRAQLNSGMLVQRKTSDDPDVHEYRPAWVSALARRAERQARPSNPPPERYFSPAALHWPVHHRINALKPDVVNLHWVNDGFLSPESIGRIQAPLVWTLRDQWPMTGGCHYAGSCTHFEQHCGQCPALRSSAPRDLAYRVFERKRRAWPSGRITVVALSHWLAALARRSALFAESEVLVIPNALDISVFRPSPRADARAALGLPQDRRLILFGALQPVSDRRKGFEELRQAATLLAHRPDAEELDIVIFGPLYGRAAPQLALPTHYLGGVDDDARLAQLYASADVVVMPSLEEAFGKVAMEALACGTPVVCFRDSGPADIVDHLRSGYQAEYGSVSDLAAGISFVLDHPDPSALTQAGLTKVRSQYTYTQQAAAYSAVYRRVLEQSGARPPRQATHA